LRVVREGAWVNDEVAIDLAEREGPINSNLSLGASTGFALRLMANVGMSHMGLILVGSGFVVTHDEAVSLGLGSSNGLDAHIRDYRNGRDLTERARGVMVVDLFGLTAEDVRVQFPAVYQWVLALLSG
jgi:hypothetical protein